MKVWEETWRTEHDPSTDAWDLIDAADGAFSLAHRGAFLTGDDPGYDAARARLAAAAPAMARLLLELHREHGDRRTFDWAYWFQEIEATLTKAGVPFEEAFASQRHGEEP